jgi:long-subunit acyl-CoA synthetase (AMP-forming)
MNLIELFDRGAEREPARICVVDETASKTYREMQLGSYRIANAIADLGFEPGTKIATLSDNRATTLECAVGIIRAGGVWVPVATNRSAEATAAMLGGLDAALLLYSDRQTKAAYDVARSCPSLRKTVNIDASDAYSPSLQTLMASSSAADPRIDRSASDVVTLFSSGGTTGTPKGVMMTNLAWETFIAGFMTGTAGRSRRCT